MRGDRVSPLLRVRDLKIGFDLPEGHLLAVDGASFQIGHGATVALVGESGSGKTVVSQAIMGLLPKPAHILGGQIFLADPAAPGIRIDIARLPPGGREMRQIRGGQISIIFQEPMTSLSPLHTIGDQIGEALSLHRDVDGAQARELTRDMLRMVGFPDPEKALTTYPFELSGGLRQRAMISIRSGARAQEISDESTRRQGGSDQWRRTGAGRGRSADVCVGRREGCDCGRT